MSEQNELLKAVHDLRESYDANVKRLESEQIERDAKINLRIDELAAKAQKPRLPDTEDERQGAYSKAFGQWARTGDGSVLKAVAMDVTTGANGEVAVPETLDRNIYSLMLNMSPMRQLANIITVGSENYKKLVNTHGVTHGWVAETAARGNTNIPQFAELTPSMGEIYAAPLATQKSLEDVFFNVEQFLASEIADAFAIAEGAAFVTGNGTSRPKGFLAGNVVTSADSARSFGDIQYIATGVDGAFGTVAANSSDILFDVVASLKAGHRPNAAWQMAKATLTKIRKFKDTTNQYLWQPGLQAGAPSNLVGFPVYENEDMAAIASNSYSIAFGDFKRAYTIVDRRGSIMLRDPYTQVPYVKFYVTKRVGGMLVDSEAVKVVKFYTS